MPKIEELIEKSKGSDIQVLLAAKEKAKMAASQNPTAANISALDKATRMLNAAMDMQDEKSRGRLATYKDVLAYVEDAGRKLAKTKLYDDVRAGRLRKMPDGTFRKKDVDKYILKLPTMGTPDGLAEKVADRQRRKEEADIRRAEAAAKREEFDLAVKTGRYILREDVYHELAVRAVTLREGLKVTMLAHAPKIIGMVGGDASKADDMMAFYERMIDELMGQYARPIIIEAVFDGLENEHECAGDEERGEGIDI